jgi:deoxyribose-phosphate aldolase
MIDLSAVRAESDDRAIGKLVACAREYQVGLVTVLPAQTSLARRLLGFPSTIKLGGNVGFPSGGQTKSIKVKETRELVKLGCDELDVMINLAAFLSGRLVDVFQELQAVVQAAEGLPVKAILECHYLTAEQVRQGCDLAIQAGAAFVKTGTGWAPGGVTFEQVALIKAHVGSRIGIKASGGIRSLETILKMYELGASRFGISLASGIKILEQIYDPGL